jgi:hypothetical protein
VSEHPWVLLVSHTNVFLETVYNFFLFDMKLPWFFIKYQNMAFIDPSGGNFSRSERSEKSKI